MNKKGLDISLNFVIIAALALIALIVIALIFTGGIQKLIGQQDEVVGVSAEQIAVSEQSCKTSCSLNSKTSWDNPSFPEAVAEDYRDCDALLPGYKWVDGECLKPGEE